MYKEWPFFRVTIDLLEMVFAQGDPSIAALYDESVSVEWRAYARLGSVLSSCQPPADKI